MKWRFDFTNFYVVQGGTMKKRIRISDAVRMRRLELGWGTKRLALAADVPRSLVTKVESGTESPTVRTLEKIGSAMGLDLVFIPREASEVYDGPDHGHELALLGGRIFTRQEFARRVRARRRQLGLTQKELAAILGVHVSMVSQTERALRGSALRTQIRFVKALGGTLPRVPNNRKSR